VDPARVALRDVGRTGRLELVFDRRGGRTVLAHQYAEPPLRIGSTFVADEVASLILVCAGPGIFAGDTLRQSVHVQRGARVVLASQSALQVHPSAADAPARIAHAYRVDEGGELHCHWDALIPFADARVEQRFDIDVAAGGRLYWSDALMSGRASRGETWRFARVAHELRVRVAGTLVYLERYGIAPAERGVTRPWIAGPEQYFGTSIVCHPDATADAADALQHRFEEHADVEAAADAVADGVLLVRLASASGAAFAAARDAVRQTAAAEIFRLPALANRR